MASSVPPTDVTLSDARAAQVSASHTLESGPGETEQELLERLGRQRPDRFKSIWQEIGFVASVTFSMALTEYSVSGFSVLVPTLSESLNISQSKSTWPANAFALVIACFMLPFGRLADIYGGFPVYIAGVSWFTIWAFITGWSQNEIMMDLCRAIQGLGPAAYLPTGIMLIGSFYRPGPRKNLAFAVYGAMAPLGFYIGIFFAGLTAQFTTWRWYFFIAAILGALVVVLTYLCCPNDHAERKGMGSKMDWWGTLTISVGLILVVYAITDSAHAPHGWATPYIIVTLVLGVIILAVAVYIEGWVAEQPLLPFDLFKVRYMAALCVALFFCWGALGILMLYGVYYMSDVMGGTPIQIAAWWTPMALGGIILSTVGGTVLHRLPGTLTLILSCATWIIPPLLFALAPEGASYWRWTFPAMITATLAIDIMFTVTNVFIANSLPLRFQGLAGALINTLVMVGIAVFLGLADVIAANVESKGATKKEMYKTVFWFEVGCAATALLICAVGVRIRKAESGLTRDEEDERKKAAA